MPVLPLRCHWNWSLLLLFGKLKAICPHFWHPQHWALTVLMSQPGTKVRLYLSPFYCWCKNFSTIHLPPLQPPSTWPLPPPLLQCWPFPCNWPYEQTMISYESYAVIGYLSLPTYVALFNSSKSSSYLFPSYLLRIKMGLNSSSSVRTSSSVGSWLVLSTRLGLHSRCIPP